MPSSDAAWVAGIDLPLLDRRFGRDFVNRELGASRTYAEPPPRLDAAVRLLATLDVAKLAVRMRGETIEVSCSCRSTLVCDHVKAVLVDVGAHPGFRAALAAGDPTAPFVAELPSERARALDERTFEERLALWLPPRKFENDFEIDVAAIRNTSPTHAEERPALLVRHRRPPSRALIRPKEILEARLSSRHRRLVELTAPYHLDRTALISTRGQASLLIHLLRDEIGVLTRSFKAKVRFARGDVRPRLEREGDRIVARWYTGEGDWVGDAKGMLLFTGPFPYIWSEENGTFYAVASDVDLDAAWGFQLAPSLPLTVASEERIGRALLLRARGLGVSLPAPEVFGLPPLEAPTYELRLGGSPLDVRGELFAVYSAGKFPMSRGREDPLDGRDIEAEEQALALLHEAGLDPDDQGAFIASEDRAVHLWKSGLEGLRASTSPRFEVLVSEALTRVRVGPPVRVDVSVGVATGWLDTELKFNAGALAVEIRALHEALASSKRWLALSDGSLAKISDEVATLVGESAVLLDKAGRGALAPYHLGRLERWAALADGSVTLDARATELRDRLRAVASLPSPKLPSRLEATLRPYQRGGLAWLQLLRDLGAGGVLADDMGLGKTLMTLAFLARWKEDSGGAPSLVVCPTSVVGNWAREAERFTPGLRVTIARGASRDAATIDDHDLVVTTYGLLRRDVDRLAERRFRCVVLDEAQNVKNPSAATSRAARRLNAEMRLALSGTPVENRLSELWSIMTFANPGLLGSAADFEERYERPITSRPDGAVAAELREAVRPFILRRTKSAVVADLPPKTEVDRACVFGVTQTRLYDALALALRQAVSKDVKKRGMARTHLTVLTAFLRLRQMACDPRLVDPDASPADSAKRVAFLDLVRELVSEDRRALVFSQFVGLLSLWREDLDRANVAYEYLDGSTTNRDAVVERFQRGNAPLFLISLKAGGAGLNLTAADTVIHCDPWWNPAVEDQATDRAHRIGQSRTVTVVRLVAQGTIEEKIALLKEKKRELTEAVIGENADALRGLTEDDVRLLLGDVEGDPDLDASDAT